MVMPFPGVSRKPQKLVWKASTVEALNVVNQTAAISWTDLDLTTATSPNAKAAYVIIFLTADVLDAAAEYVLAAVRRNGDTPGHYSRVLMEYTSGYRDGSILDIPFWIGLDSGQVIEYSTGIGGTVQYDLRILVLAYIE